MKGHIYFELARVYWECQAHFGLSNGATSLYFYLLHRFNQARWPKTLAVSSLEIGGILGISKPSLLKFKDELVNCGILDADFRAGRIRQDYSLKSPTLTFGGVDFEVPDEDPGKPPGKAPGKAPGQNILPYNSNTKTKTNTPSNPPSRGNDKEKEKAAMEIYSAYPRKVARPKALAAIKKAIGKIGKEELMKRTQAYAQAIEGKESQFIPYPATWFGQERYEDDPEEWVISETKAPKGNVYYWMQREKELKEEMRQYRNAHRSEAALTTTWDPGTREKYNEMAKELESLRMTLEELN